MSALTKHLSGWQYDALKEKENSAQVTWWQMVLEILDTAFMGKSVIA